MSIAFKDNTKTFNATSIILSLRFSLTLINPRGRVILASLVD